MKVSVVLPTYNGEKYIRQSIESVLNQTYYNLELIIVDDCSTDNTLSIANEYKMRDDRVVVVHNIENQKLPKSLNIGFRHAKGEYLTWTSDDNYYLPTAIEKMVHFLNEHNDIPMVVAGIDFVDEQGEFISTHMNYNDDRMCSSNCVGACFLYRKQVIKDIGEYDYNMFLVEDYDYWLRILFYYGHIGRIDEVLYKYRNHGGSLTTTRANEIKKQLTKLRLKFLESIIARMSDNKEALCKIYYELKKENVDIRAFYSMFIEFIPEISYEGKIDDSKGIVVYGAGAFGDLVYKRYNKKIVYYADGNENKVGQKKNGIAIISVEEMVEKADEYNIIIAVSEEKIYQLVKRLCSNGVKKFSVYQSLIS